MSLNKNYLLICVNALVPDADKAAWLNGINQMLDINLTLDLFGNSPYQHNGQAWLVSCFSTPQVSDKLTNEAIQQISSTLDPNLIVCAETDGPVYWLADNGFTQPESDVI